MDTNQATGIRRQLTYISSFNLAVLLFLFLLASNVAHAQPSCKISLEKKELISKLLCGEFEEGSDQAYRFSGPNCVKASASKRLEDSALQIQLYKLCGDTEFSDQLMDANLKAMDFIQVLAVCTDEQVELKDILSDRMAYVRTRIGADSCPPSIKQKLDDRRQFFQKQIEFSKQSNLNEKMLDMFKVQVDSAGNISEK
jgi:hypothetical protein